MYALLQDPVLYWLVWMIATVFGIIIGWTAYGALREKKLREDIERIHQERNSVAHLYSQLRSQHDQKTAEFKKVSLEAHQMRDRIQAFEVEAATRDANRQLEANRLIRAQDEATHAMEKVILLEENIEHLRMRDQQYSAEVTRLHEELNGWKKLQRDFSNLLRQMQELEMQAQSLDQERNQLIKQLEISRNEISNLQNSLALANSTADSDSDQRDSTIPSGHFDEFQR